MLREDFSLILEEEIIELDITSPFSFEFGLQHQYMISELFQEFNASSALHTEIIDAYVDLG